MKKLALSTFVVVITQLSILAQATLVKDINPTGDAFKTQNSNQRFVQNGKYIFFVADNGKDGYELYRTDGTSAGTAMVKNFNPTGDGFIRGLTIFKNEVYFSAYNGTTDDFYKSDGTDAGTILLAKNVQIGNTLYKQAETIVFKDELYFSEGANLWKTNGTAAGTQKVKTFYTGSFAFPVVKNFAIHNNKLYYATNTSNFDISLIETDGTTAGTKAIPKIDPSIYEDVDELTECNGKLLFSNNYKTKGNAELFVSDGTVTGTVFLKDLNGKTAASDGTYPSFFTTINGTTIFLTDGKIWQTDGTAAGTTAITNFNAGTSQGDSNPFVSNGKLLFSSGGTSFGSQYIWATDGTAAGTNQLSSQFLSIAPSFLTILNSKCYFSGSDSDKGRELWVSDGTKTGTKVILDLVAGSNGSEVANIISLNNILYFIANKGDAAGFELYRFNPTVGVREELILTNAMSISPNPASQEIRIKIEQPEENTFISLYDINGRVVAHQEISNLSNATITTINLPNGIYNAIYRTYKGVQQEKVLIQY
jgi:trimeric autotransporter adhesin